MVTSLLSACLTSPMC